MRWRATLDMPTWRQAGRRYVALMQQHIVLQALLRLSHMHAMMAHIAGFACHASRQLGWLAFTSATYTATLELTRQNYSRGTIID